MAEFDMCKDKARELRNRLYTTCRALRERKTDVESGRTSGEIVEELEKIHRVLSDASVVSNAGMTKRDIRKASNKIAR